MGLKVVRELFDVLGLWSPGREGWTGQFLCFLGVYRNSRLRTYFCKGLVDFYCCVWDLSSKCWDFVLTRVHHCHCYRYCSQGDHRLGLSFLPFALFSTSFVLDLRPFFLPLILKRSLRFYFQTYCIVQKNLRTYPIILFSLLRYLGFGFVLVLEFFSFVKWLDE